MDTNLVELNTDNMFTKNNDPVMYETKHIRSQSDRPNRFYWILRRVLEGSWRDAFLVHLQSGVAMPKFLLQTAVLSTFIWPCQTVFCS